MRKSMKQRVALFLSFAMAFTSVDSSVLVAASDTTEVVSEEAQQEDTVVEEADVQQEETTVEEVAVQQEDITAEEEAQQEDVVVEEIQTGDVVADEVVQEEETAPDEETSVENEELTSDEQPAEGPTVEETGEARQEETALAEDTLTEETESIPEESTEETETDMDAITEEEDGIEEQIIGEELYELEDESVAVDENIATMADEDNEITSVSIIPERTEYEQGEGGYVGEGSAFTIIYSDGSIWNGTMYDDSEYIDGYGNDIFLNLLRESDRKEFGMSTYSPEGKYAVQFKVNNKIVATTDFLYTIVGIDSLCKGELVVGENSIESSEDWYKQNWYRFTAPETGRYGVKRGHDLYVYKKTESGMEKVDSTGRNFCVKEGETYYLGFHGPTYNPETGEPEYSWTTMLSKINKDIKNIELLSEVNLNYTASEYVPAGMKYRIIYSDGSTEEKVVCAGEPNYAENGDEIDIILEKEGTWHWASYTIEEGDYSVIFKVGNETLLQTADKIVHVLDLSEMKFSELCVGDNLISTDESGRTVWYQFTPEKTGMYKLENIPLLLLYKGSGNQYLGDYRDNQVINFEKGITYYWGFRGKGEYTVTLAPISEITGVTNVVAEHTEYEEGDLYVGEGTTFTLIYADGTEYNGTFESDRFTDDNSNEITMKLKKENDSETSYSIWDTLPAGKYAIEFCMGNKVVATTEYLFNVRSIASMCQGTLNVGENMIVSSESYSHWNWYSFTAPEAGKYFMDKVGNWGVRHKTQTGTEYIAGSGRSFRAEKGEDYYIGFWGSVDGDYSWTMTLAQGHEITDITFLDTDTRKYGVGLDTYISRGSRIRVTYGDITQEYTLGFWDTNIVDLFGNTLYFSVIDSEKKEHQVYEDLPAGKYALKVSVDEKSYTGPEIYEMVDPSNVIQEELTIGTVSLTSDENVYKWYRFTAPASGKYGFETYSNSMRVMHVSKGGMQEVDEQLGSFWAEKDQTYFIGFCGLAWDRDEEKNVYSWTTELKKILTVKDITVEPKKTHFWENETEYIQIRTITFAYDDNTTGRFEDFYRYDVDGLGNGVKYYLTSDNEEDDTHYDIWEKLKAGVYTAHIQYDQKSDIEATYNITVEEEPTPFNYKTTATEIELGKDYSVNVNEEKPAQWFCYTPTRDIEMIYQSTGEWDTYGHIYTEAGKELQKNDDDGDGNNFKIAISLKAEQKYYFKARLRDVDKEGAFQVSFTEKLQIRTLKVVEHDLKSVYLKTESIPNPSVLLTATYNKDGVSETFYRNKGDSFGNKIRGEVHDADGNVIKAFGTAGTYTYWVSCGEVATQVGAFEVKDIKDVSDQEVLENEEQQIGTKEQRLSYHFSVKETNIYEMTANAPFSNLKVYDAEENPVQLSGVQNGYTAYAALDPGEYYVVAKVSEEISRLRVKVKKATLPKEVTAVYDGTTLVAGVDSLEDQSLSIQVKYTDDTSAWIHGEGADGYGTAYSYQIKRSGDDEEQEMWYALSAGTYTIKPVVFRTGSYISADTSDNKVLKEALKEENIKSTTVKVEKPDVSQMTAIQEGEWVAVDGSNSRYFYQFTPKETGTYTFEYDGSIYDTNTFYADSSQRLINRGEKRKLKEGETYAVMAPGYTNHKFRVVKYTGNTSGTETITKEVKSMQIYSEQGFVLRDDLFDDLFFKITYADETSDIMSMPYRYGDYWYDDRTDNYGNVFKCKDVPKETQEPDGVYIQYTLVCKDKETTLKLPCFTRDEKSTKVQVNKPIQKTATQYYKFTPQESGEYIFRVTAKDWGPYIVLHNISTRSESMYEDENGNNRQVIKNLVKGKTYYFKVANYGDSNLNYTVSILKPKDITDLEITEYSKDYKVYEGIGDFGNLEIKAQVTYEDGSTEMVETGKNSESGRTLNFGNSYWLNTKTYRVVVKFGKYRAYVDIPTTSFTYSAELKEDVPVVANEDINIYSFIPSETGVYQVTSQGERYLGLIVYNAKTAVRLNRKDNWTYELLAGVKYNVVVYGEEGSAAEYKIAIGKIKTHIHSYKEVIVSATCESTGYKQQVCDVCGEVKPGSRTELPSTGHKWETKVDKAATCGAAGSQHRECSVCHTKEASTTIPATGKHNMQTKVDKTATCGAAGSQHRECSVCHTKEASTTIPATGKHNMQTIVDKAAMCGAAGSQHRECSVCHTKEAATTIPATGKHSFGGYVVTKEATVLVAGTETRTCKVCGTTESRSIAQLAATIKLTAAKVTVKVGDSAEVGKYVTGLAKGDSVASYTSSNKKAATVSKTGKVTGKAAGTAKITVKLASGKTADITVTVQKKEIATKSIKNLSKMMKIKLKGTAQLKPVISPSNTTDKLTYVSSDKKIVTVSAKGKLTAKKVGKAKITVQSGKKKFTITVTVAAPTPTGMKNVPTSKKLAKGKSFVLKPTLLPAGATGKITYKTSDKKIVTVDAKGKVTAKGKGSAVITVTVGKVKKTCKVTVK